MFTDLFYRLHTGFKLCLQIYRTHSCIPQDVLETIVKARGQFSRS